MSWFGKIMGGGFGFMLGGPIGALVGATLGHALFDDKVRMERGEAGPMNGLEHRQAVFFTATFALLGKIAKADGKVCDDEIRVIEAFMRDRLNLAPQARQFAVGIFEEAKDNNVPFEDYARQLGEVFRQVPQMRLMFYELLFSVAMADGVLHPAEDTILKASPAFLGLPSDVYATVKRQFVSDLSHHYAVLGLGETATQAEVKKAYRKLVTEYHPDKVIAKGMPEDFVKFAEEKFREINEAYEAINNGTK